MGARLEAELSKIKSTGRDSNPRRRITGAVSSPLDDQCVCSVGLVGIEPTSSGLRDRCITLSATIPFQSARWELNPRPASYKDAALTAELRASASRAGGIRTHAMRIKSPPCCLLHHDPVKRSGVCVSSGVAATSSVLLLVWLSVVAPRIELGTTRLSAVSGRPALDYLVQVGHPGVEPRPSCSRSRRAPICTSARLLSVRTAGFEPAISWPPTRRDTRLRHVLIKYPVGESNPNPAGIRSPSAAPLDGAQSARTIIPVGWEALESSSPALQTGARPSQLPAHQRKKPGVLWTPGFGKLALLAGPSVTSASSARGAY
jgi:hypothetical protein